MKPRKMLKKDWIGVRVKAVKPVSNGYGTVKAGTYGVVTSTHQGKFYVTFDLCSHCGFQLRVSGVSEGSLELVKGEATPLV